jgi:hypothetical protein
MRSQDTTGSHQAPTASYAAKDIEEWLGDWVVIKGRGYLGAVEDLRVESDTLTASVRGTRPRPYRVDIRFQPAPAEGARPRFYCSCPVGGHCKHAAAVLLKALEERDHPDQVRPEVLNWVQELRRLADTPKSGKRAKAAPTIRLFYLVDGPDGRGEYRVNCYKARTDAMGRPTGALQGWSGFERALANPPQFVDEEDLGILRLLWAQRPREHPGDTLLLDGRHGDEVLRRMLASCRWLMDRDTRLPWRLGPERPAMLAWRPDSRGRLHARLSSRPESARAIPLDPPWYLDPVSGEAGALKSAIPPSLARQLLTGPSLSPSEAQVVAATLAEIAPDLPSPAGSNEAFRVVEASLTPVLQISTANIYGLSGYRDYGDEWDRRLFDYAVPAFRYGVHRFGLDEKQEFVTLATGETVRIRRDPQAEARLIGALAELGFTPVPHHAIYAARPLPRPSYGLASEAAWEDFKSELLPRLRAAGWEVELPPDFRHDYRAAPLPARGPGLAAAPARHDLGGILADDMGLGKTAQTLAHLLTEKQAGRLDKPALVVLPTSLVFNWQREAERFAPDLKVLNLHGADRHARFDELIPRQHDVTCLTTYPLLWRDPRRWRARSTADPRRGPDGEERRQPGRAGGPPAEGPHRLCLTGTPLENHLGELWAQFDFLLPGFLGTHKEFTRAWRTPIEKHGDTVRRDLLARRACAPSSCAGARKTSPPSCRPRPSSCAASELEGGQRDLYETVRAAMDEKVRAEIAGKGFARSQIVILDALLKLRQVCCDPRLLKSTAAAR